jgi:hypothetical protein
MGEKINRYLRKQKQIKGKTPLKSPATAEISLLGK